MEIILEKKGKILNYIVGKYNMRGYTYYININKIPSRIGYEIYASLLNDYEIRIRYAEENLDVAKKHFKIIHKILKETVKFETEKAAEFTNNKIKELIGE
jgi:hypothetical protein